MGAGEHHEPQAGRLDRPTELTGIPIAMVRDDDITLTARQKQILEMVALGHSAKGIARRFSIAHRTVETHLDTMRLKLRARNTSHMVAIAITTGILPRSGIQREAEK